MLGQQLIGEIAGLVTQRVRQATAGMGSSGKINLNPPQGFHGKLQQRYVAYDFAESEESSGSPCLLDNLATMRQRITGSVNQLSVYSGGSSGSPTSGSILLEGINGIHISVVTGGSPRIVFQGFHDDLYGVDPLEHIDWTSASAGFQTSGSVSAGSLQVLGPRSPASSAASGIAGEIVWDTGFLYVCVSANSWKRVALETW